MYIPPSGARGLERFPPLKNNNVQFSQMGIFRAPWLHRGGGTYTLADFFVQNSISNNFYLMPFLMQHVFLAVLSPKQNLLFHFEYWYIFVRRPTRGRDCGVAFLPSWLDTLVSIFRLWYSKFSPLFYYKFLQFSSKFSQKYSKIIRRQFR